MKINRDKARETLRRLVVAIKRSADHSIMLAADAYALTVHVEACRETSGNGYSGPWSFCGDVFQTGRRGARIKLDTIWYCSVAEQYLPPK